MTKQLIALAIAAAFGVAHAADVKPAAEPKPAAAPTAAVVKAEAPKSEVKAPEVKPAAAAPEVKAEAKPADNQHVKKVKHVRQRRPRFIRQTPRRRSSRSRNKLPAATRGRPSKSQPEPGARVAPVFCQRPWRSRYWCPQMHPWHLIWMVDKKGRP